MNRRLRRLIFVISGLFTIGLLLILHPKSYESTTIIQENSTTIDQSNPNLAINLLQKLEIKGRAPKTGYKREEFYKSWPNIDGCSLRQRIIKREFGDTTVLDSKDKCSVIAGSFIDPYTGEHRSFTSKSDISKALQIDHVVALSDSWQKGAQYLSKEIRFQIATDPLNLLAADGPANMQKGDGDAATWLPPNKNFRCQYVARQISVKAKYALWVTEAEHNAMQKVLEKCPDQLVPAPKPSAS